MRGGNGAAATTRARAAGVNAAERQGAETRGPRAGVTTKERIESAGLDLFYRQGFRTTTMREITSACGLTSAAAFYNHFESKDELLLQIIMGAFEELEKRVKVSLGKGPKAGRAQLEALVRTMTVWHCEHIHRASVANRESIELPAKMVAKVRQRRRRLKATAEKIIVRGIEEGEFASSGATPEVTARITSTAIFGVVQSISVWYIESGTWSPETLADFFVELALRMVGASDLPSAKT